VGYKEGKEGDSHTICPPCLPGYLREQGLPEDEIKYFTDKYCKDD
jgi:hypothetical protein